LEASACKARFIACTWPAVSCAAFANEPIFANYAAMRDDTLLTRYRIFLAQGYCAGSVDFQFGVEDCFSGRIAGISAFDLTV